ncbi:MAG: hypothetical protein J5865_06120 [Lachnospiraceae bacterium]|nr:hypothetical protein [Lachnospiraceae bacterium]
MKYKRWMILLAAVLILSACSSVKPPATDAPSRSGETLPNKPAETQTSGVPMSSRAAETRPSAEVPETSPVQTEPESSEIRPAVPESSEAETSAEPETREEAFVMPDFYTGKIYRVGKYWYGDDEGNDYVMDPEGHLLDYEKIPTPILDELSGEVKFYSRTEYTRIGEGEEDVKVSSTLYDTEGNILEADVPFLYNRACGSCVVRLDSRAALMWEGQFNGYSGDLYDPYARKVVREGVCNVTRLTENSALATDSQGVLLGVVDADGAVLAGFPMDAGPFKYPYVYGNGFVLTYTEDEDDLTSIILNSRLEYVDYADENESYRVFNCGERGYVLAKRLEDGGTWILDLDKWEVLLTTEYSVERMDGERIICEKDDQYWLLDWNGNKLAGPYDDLQPARETEDDPLEGLIGKEGTTVCRMDLDGNVLNKLDIPRLSYISVYDGIVYCSTDEYDSETGYYGYGMVILNYELRQFIPSDYTSIGRVAPGIYACPIGTPQGESRVNLFNAEGEMIFSGAMSVGQGDEHAIPVLKGFSVGLIDLQGNWIAKNNRYEQEPGD